MRPTLFGRALLAGALLAAGFATSFAVATPASAVPGITFVGASSDMDSSTSKEAAAACPTGTRVLGGGGYVANTGHKVLLTRLEASSKLDVFHAAAREVAGGFTGSWDILAYAICGTAPAGLEFQAYHTTSASPNSRSVNATCSAGKKLVSVGARVDGSNGEVVIDDIIPNAALTSVTVTAYEDDNGYAGNWSLWAHAVCANPLPGLELRTGTTGSTSSDKSASANCPAGKKVHGMGAAMTGAAGEVHYRGIYVGTGLDGAGAVSEEDQNGFAGNWSTTSYAICAS